MNSKRRVSGFVLMTLALLLASIGPTDAAERCGGTLASDGMGMGIVVVNGRPRMRSLEAVAAITPTAKHSVVGWLGFDNRGDAWVQFAKGSADLRVALKKWVIPIGGSGLFVPLRSNWQLPPQFSLEACSFVESKR